MVSVVHVGLGPIGIEIARLTGTRGFRSVAAVDPAMSASPFLSDMTGHAAHSSVAVSGALPKIGADVALHSTGSRLERVESQLLDLVEAGLDVVSTCEELSYPWWRNREAAERIDEAARRRGVTVLGTGVNPGYAMDYLPLALSLPCQSIKAVTVHRVQDAMQRRIPLQRKVGAGMSKNEFTERAAAGELGHVGLQESAQHLATALGWNEATIEESIEPVLAGSQMVAPIGTIEADEVCGLHQEVQGFQDGERVLHMILDMALGLPDPRDVVRITGVPDVEATIAGGLHGDVATAAIVVNSISGVLVCSPGLIVSSDLAPSRAVPRESIDTASLH